MAFSIRAAGLATREHQHLQVGGAHTPPPVLNTEENQ